MQQWRRWALAWIGLLSVLPATARHDNFTPAQWKQNDSKLEPLVRAEIEAMLAQPAPVASKGCGANSTHWEDGDVVRIEFEGIQREFNYRAPLNTTVPATLVVVFHSYYFDKDFVEDWSEWTAFRDANQWIPLAILYPNGAGDSLMKQEGNATGYPGQQVPIRGWNSLGNAAGGNSTCDVDYVASAGGYPAYQSCVNKGHPVIQRGEGVYAAGGCDSGPCSDDAGFVAHIVQLAMDEACLDRRRVFATGQSNGGMMTEQVGEDPRTAALFAGGVQVSGSALYGHNNPPADDYSLMTFRGNRDDTIPYNTSAEDQTIQKLVANGTIPNVPPGTSVSNDGFFYVDEKNVMKQYAEQLQCQHPQGVEFDPSCDGVWVHDIGLQCWAYGKCGNGSGLVSCLFEGKHHMPWNNCEGDTGCLDPKSWSNHSEGKRNVYAHSVFNRVAFHFMLQHPKLRVGDS